ncbi:tetratricopeptide repeat protein [Nonomuraea sp. SMC257]|uniref:Tetratricopeptide repeat protein n=1 Tax=Nonomuraea montanisoli TaxID=2741721 RepID=A0A7Y6IAJ7_9ACTN|nr:tetratricopeptide repeat protein [Nonomuraea montanisoli]NUW33910.1 tetratricopeptide repeat protein [Nonomuraea montanisoli]
MEFRVLGTLELRLDGSPVPLTAPKQRALLAVLLIAAGRPVPARRLVDELWGGSPPRSVDSTLHSLVSRLRAKGVSAITREPGGYRLGLEKAAVDAHAFERLAGRARESARSGAPGEAARLCREALDLWRAAALVDVPDSPAVAAERARLDGLRLAVWEEYADALAEAGRPAEVAACLRGVLAEHPLRESLWTRMIVALDRSGRPDEALAAYDRARRALAEELGLDPGPELRRVHQRILRRGEEPPAGTASRVRDAESHAGAARQAGGAEAARRVGGAGMAGQAGSAWAAGQVGGRERPAGVEAPRQLPPAPGCFTGRAATFHELTALTEPGRPGVAVISGMPGVGKSALALHWAHRMAGRFPDGQLFADLRGHRPREAVTPREALDRFVRALGMPAEQVPAGQDELAAAYRTLLAGRRVLVVLDDAAGPAQVEPLLPAGEGCLVLVTSRGRLSGLALRHATRAVDLDVLSEPEAVALLTEVIGPRCRAEPGAVAELARQCGRLPLALRIAAAHLAGTAHRRISVYLDDLAERGRLASLRLRDAFGDMGVDASAAAVQATFDLSYRALGEAERTAFRRLGLVPGGGFTADALAALLAVPPAEARARLDVLLAASLVQARPGRAMAERYHLHDLLLDYARHRAEAEDAAPAREQAVGRLLSWYATIGDPLALHDDLDNVLAATRDAAEAGAEAAWRLPAALARTLALADCPARAAELHALAVTAAGRAGRRREAAGAHNDLGEAYERLGRYPEALAEHGAALELHRRLGDRRGTGAALRSVGTVHWLLGRYDDALAHLYEARDVMEATGDEGALGQTYNLIGIVLRTLGRMDEAVSWYERALAVHRPAGDRNGEANALNNLGVIHAERGRHAVALGLYRRALALRRATGSRRGEARALNNIGLMEIHLGRRDRALVHLRRALAVHRETGDRRGEGQVAHDLGGLYHLLGREEEALAHYAEALRVRSEIGDRRGLAETHRDLGKLHADRGDEVAARHHGGAAGQIFTELGVTA